MWSHWHKCQWVVRIGNPSLPHIRFMWWWKSLHLTTGNLMSRNVAEDSLHCEHILSRVVWLQMIWYLDSSQFHMLKFILDSNYLTFDIFHLYLTLDIHVDKKYWHLTTGNFMPCNMAEDSLYCGNTLSRVVWLQMIWYLDSSQFHMLKFILDSNYLPFDILHALRFCHIFISAYIGSSFTKNFVVPYIMIRRNFIFGIIVSHIWPLYTY